MDSVYAMVVGLVVLFYAAVACVGLLLVLSAT